MSFHSKHMDHPVKGARIMENRGEDSSYLSRFSLEEIFQESLQQYGNTKFQDYAIIIAFLKCGGRLVKASAMVGFATGKGSARGMLYRISKVNTRSFLETARMAMRSYHVTMEELTVFMSTTKHLGKDHKRIGKSIAESAVRKWKGKKEASKRLRISVEMLNFWLSV